MVSDSDNRPEYTDEMIRNYYNNPIDEDEIIESEIRGNEHDFECGYIRGEGCFLVGTEDCDFECPYRNVLFSRVDSSPVPPIDLIPF